MLKTIIKCLKGVSILILLMFSLDASAKTFIIGVENLPYTPHYSMENGQYTGYAREVLDAFAKSKGYTFEYRSLPVLRLFRNFVDGEVDFKYPDNEHWQREIKKGKKIIYSNSVVNYIDGVMVLPANKGKGKGNLKTLGTVLGFTPWDYLSDIKAGKTRLAENSHIEGMLRQTLTKRIDGAYCNVAVAEYKLQHVMNQPDSLVFDRGLPHTKGTYKLSTIKYPVVVKEFNLFLSNNAEFIKRLKAKYQVEKGFE